MFQELVKHSNIDCCSRIQLAKRVDPSKVIIFDAEPGLCEKPIWRGPDSELSPWDKFYKRAFSRTIEAGSRTVVKGLLKGPILWHNYLQGNVYTAGWAAVTP
jgi:hypothetical protein